MRTCSECRFATWDEPKEDEPNLRGHCHPIPHMGIDSHTTYSHWNECWFFKEIEEPEGEGCEVPEEEEETEEERWQRIGEIRRAGRP